MCKLLRIITIVALALTDCGPKSLCFAGLYSVGENNFPTTVITSKASFQKKTRQSNKIVQLRNGRVLRTTRARAKAKARAGAKAKARARAKAKARARAKAKARARAKTKKANAKNQTKAKPKPAYLSRYEDECNAETKQIRQSIKSSIEELKDKYTDAQNQVLPEVEQRIAEIQEECGATFDAASRQFSLENKSEDTLVQALLKKRISDIEAGFRFCELLRLLDADTIAQNCFKNDETTARESIDIEEMAEIRKIQSNQERDTKNITKRELEAKERAEAEAAAKAKAERKAAEAAAKAEAERKAAEAAAKAEAERKAAEAAKIGAKRDGLLLRYAPNTAQSLIWSRIKTELYQNKALASNDGHKKLVDLMNQYLEAGAGIPEWFKSRTIQTILTRNFKRIHDLSYNQRDALDDSDLTSFKKNTRTIVKEEDKRRGVKEAYALETIAEIDKCLADRNAYQDMNETMGREKLGKAMLVNIAMS